MENLDIRLLVSDSKLHYKDIAQEIGINRDYFCRMMAKPLSEKNRIRVLDAIISLKNRK